VAVVTNLGTGGSVLDAQFGSSPTSNTNEPLLLSHTGTNYLYLPGVAGNGASTPSSAALSMTGDLEIVVRVALDDWTPSAFSVLVSKRNGSTAGYELAANAAGGLQFLWMNGTSNGEAVSFTLPFADSAAYWVRFTFDADNGSGQRVGSFFYAADQATEPSVWTTVNTVTTAGTATLSTDATALSVGQRPNTGNPTAGKFYRAIVRDGIGGSTVFDADFTQGITSGAQTTFTATTGQTVTINRSTAGRKSVAVVRPVWLLGTDDFFEVADNALLDFDATDSFTVVAVVRQWATPTSNGRYVDKRQTSDLAGYGLSTSGTALTLVGVIDAGATEISRSLTTISAGAISALGMVVDRSAQTLATFNGSSLSATASTTTVGSLASTAPLRIGALGSGTNYSDFECYAVAVFRRALTAGEIATIAAYYGAI
jgi:hypothetical protein